HVGLVRNHLLGPDREGCGFLGRQAKGLVVRTGMQALGAAEDGTHGLKGDPDYVVARLLRGKRAATRLGVKPKRLGPRVRGTIPILHQRCPQPAGSPELGHLLKEVAEDGKKERQPWGKVFHMESGSLSGIPCCSATSS